jgi:hypothetical protein
MSFDRRQGQERQKRPAQLMPEDRQKILAALSNVFHTSGIPTDVADVKPAGPPGTVL